MSQRRERLRLTLVLAPALGLAASLGLSSCSSSGAADTRAFAAPPMTNDLIIVPQTKCSGTDVEIGDVLRLSGFDFTPGSQVTLRWNNDVTDQTGIWHTVTTDDAGEFSKSVKLTPAVGKLNQDVQITAEGQGSSGLMVLAATVTISKC